MFSCALGRISEIVDGVLQVIRDEFNEELVKFYWDKKKKED